MDRKKAIDRIRKLLENRGRTPEESATRAAMAVRLMAKHGIESIEQVEAESDPIGLNEDYAVEISGGDRYPRWKWQLAWAVAVPMLCKIMLLNRKVEDKVIAKLVTFVGRRSDAQGCAYIFRYLVDELVRIHDEERPRFRPPTGIANDRRIELAAIHKKHLRQWSKDFYMAAVEVLRQRLDEARQDVMKTASSTALVRVDNVRHEIDAIAAELGISWETPRETEVRTDGVVYGVRAGRSIDLRRDRTPLKQGQGQLPEGTDDDH